jgi:hypothetical protein
MTGLKTLAILAILVTSMAKADSWETPKGAVNSRPESYDGMVRSFTGKVKPFKQLGGVLHLQYTSQTTFIGEFSFQDHKGTASGSLSGHFTSPDHSTFEETLILEEGTDEYEGISGHIDFRGAIRPDFTGTDTVTGGQVFLP